MLRKTSSALFRFNVTVFSVMTSSIFLSPVRLIHISLDLTLSRFIRRIWLRRLSLMSHDDSSPNPIPFQCFCLADAVWE
jgi:hypothetical protein